MCGMRGFRSWQRASKLWRPEVQGPGRQRELKQPEAIRDGKRMTAEANWRAIVVGGHTRSIGKTQLVCDLIGAFPEANWIAGKITQYGHGVCAQNGEDCDCAPDEHVCAISWESRADTGTDSGRFLASGAQRSFWLRTKQGYLAEGMPLLRAALREVAAEPAGEPRNLILESNTLLQFWKPALYLVVVHPGKADFKDSARLQLDRASAFVLREPLPEASPFAGASATVTAALAAWSGVPLQLLRGKPQFLQREGDKLPRALADLVRIVLSGARGMDLSFSATGRNLSG
jgi:hypothetical protein